MIFQAVVRNCHIGGRAAMEQPPDTKSRCPSDLFVRLLSPHPLRRLRQPSEVIRCQHVLTPGLHSLPDHSD
jgi:hypothetical protein